MHGWCGDPDRDRAVSIKHSLRQLASFSVVQNGAIASSVDSVSRYQDKVNTGLSSSRNLLRRLSFICLKSLRHLFLGHRKHVYMPLWGRWVLGVSQRFLEVEVRFHILV